MKQVMRMLIASAALFRLGLVQPTVAPTSEPVGATRGDNWSDYNIVDSFETGYRFRTFGGSFDQYRGTVNYGDGIRLLSSFFTMNSSGVAGAVAERLEHAGQADQRPQAGAEAIAP